MATIPLFDAAEIVDPALRRLHAYWDSKRGTRAMPRRADIDPLDMPYALGYVVMVDVLRKPLRFRIRLHGSELVRRVGYELTGKMLDELPIPEFRRLVQMSFTAVAEGGQPLRLARRRRLENRVYDYETLMMPLSNDGERVDMILSAVRYTDRDALTYGRP